MKLWPEPSSTVVSARRVVSAGTSKPLSRIAPSVDSSDTSGRTRIEMRPSSSTVGVKARPTPYCLYSIVTVPSDWEIGIGNSPPARKLAVSPDKRGQGRLGERGDEAVVLGEVERAEQVEAEQAAGGAERGAVAGCG